MYNKCSYYVLLHVYVQEEESVTEFQSCITHRHCEKCYIC